MNQLLSEPVEPSRDRRISIGATARPRIYARLPRKRRRLFRARSCLGSFVCAPPILVHGGGCLSRNHDADHLVDTRAERAVARRKSQSSVFVATLSLRRSWPVFVSDARVRGISRNASSRFPRDFRFSHLQFHAILVPHSTRLILELSMARGAFRLFWKY